MEKNEKITYFLDIAMTSLITLLIIYSAQTLGITMLFLLVPSIVIFLKYGLKEFLATTVITTVVSAFLMDWESIVLIMSMIVILTLIISNMLKSKENIYKIIITSTIVFATLMALYVIIITYAYKINLTSIIKSVTDQVTVSLEKFINEDMNMGTSKIDSYLESARSLVNYSVSIMPSIILVSGLIFSATNILASVNLFNKTEEKSLIKLNKKGTQLKDTIRKIVLAMSVIYFIVMIVNLSKSDLIENNLSFLVLFLLFVNGVNAAYKFSKNKIGTLSFIVFIILFVIVLQGYTIVSIFGMLDLFFNLSGHIPMRKRK